MPDPSALPDRSRVAANAVILSAAHFLAAAIVAVYTICLVRFLGPKTLGRFTIFAIWTDLIFMVFDAGVSQAAMRMEAQKPSEALRIFRTALALKFGLNLVAAALALGVLRVWFGAGLDAQAALAATAASAAASFAMLYVAHFKALELALPITVAAVGSGLLSAGIGLGLIWAKWGLAALLLVPGFGALGKILYLEVAMRRLKSESLASPERSKLSAPLAMELLRHALPLGAGEMFRILAMRLDTLLLAAWSTELEVGLYNACLRVHNYAQNFLEGYYGAVMPVMAHRFAHDRQGLERVSEQTAAVASMVAVPLALGAAGLAGPAVALLYGHPFVAAGPALLFLGLSLASNIVNGTYASILISGDRASSRAYAAGWAGGLAAMAASSAVLIPALGSKGAALSCLMMGWCAHLWFMIYTDKRLFPVRILAPFSACAPAGCAAVLAFWALSPLGDWPAGAAGFVAYILVLLRGGIYSDLAATASSLRGMLHRRKDSAT
ncbi:MAG: oligosaccharide flippase family protein [Candidatus Wallbacteria bacterium]|nr:oligosaccharide flippase family protein [Candidatus Wallbacteria bacterium]